MIGFANGATETLSQIVLDSITTENTFNMEEHYAVEVADSEVRYEKRVKWKLTLSDFMGIYSKSIIYSGMSENRG